MQAIRKDSRLQGTAGSRSVSQCHYPVSAPLSLSLSLSGPLSVSQRQDDEKDGNSKGR